MTDGGEPRRNVTGSLLARGKGLLASLGVKISPSAAESYVEALNDLTATPADFDRIRDVLEEQLRSLDDARHRVESQLAIIETRKFRRGYEWDFSDVFWDQRRSALIASLGEDPASGFASWAEAVAEAVINWEFEECLRLADPSLPLPEDGWIGVDRVAEGAQALTIGDYTRADGLLAYLADGAPLGQMTKLGDTSRSTIETLRARALLTTVGDFGVVAGDEDAQRLSTAKRHLDRAVDLDPDNPLPHVTLAAIARWNGAVDEAAETAGYAVQLAPEMPDGHLELAILAELAERWPEATASYRKAASAFAQMRRPVSAAGSLLRNPTSMLWLRLAARLQTMGYLEEAEEAVAKVATDELRGPGNQSRRWTARH